MYKLYANDSIKDKRGEMGTNYYKIFILYIFEGTV